MGGVQLSPNIESKRVFIDLNGNEVKPYTKEVIKKVEREYIPTQEDVKPKEEQKVDLTIVENSKIEILPPLSIKQQIEQAEEHLAVLKVQRFNEIERKKAELAELEADE